MNYFFELLDSYKQRGCCVTRIDEKAKPAKQSSADPRLESLQKLIATAKTSQIGATIQATTGGNIVPVTIRKAGEGKGALFNLDFKGAQFPVPVNDNGIVSTDQQFITSNLTKLFGELGEEGAQEPQEQQPQQPQQKLDPYKIEKMQKSAQIQKTKDQLSENMIILAQKVIQESTPLQLCKLQVGNAINATQKAISKGGYKGDKAAIAEETYELFKSGNYCQARDLMMSHPQLLGLVYDTEEKLTNALTAAHANSVLQQLAEISNLTTAKVRDFFYNEDCPRNVKRSDCVSLTDAAKIAENTQFEKALNNFNDFMTALVNDEIPEDPLEVQALRNLVRFTRQGDMIIQGDSIGKGIAVRDRGRLMYDFLSLAFKRSTKKDLIVYDLKSTYNGGDISIRGLVFEHMFPLLGLFKSRDKALAEGNKKLANKITKSIDKYVGSIDKICRFLQSFREFATAYNNHRFALKEKDLQAFDAFRGDLENLKDCKDLTPVLTGAMGRAEQRFSVMDPDFSLQVGKETTDGTREDILYCYENINDARLAAKKSNLPDNSIEIVRMKDIIDLAPNFAKAIPPELLGDLNREVAVIREGLKLSTQGKTRLGSVSISKQVSLMLKNIRLNENQKKHIAKSRETLGIRPKDYAKITKHQNSFAKQYEEVEGQINNIKKVSTVSVDGKQVKETGVTALDDLLKERRKNLSAKAAKNDPVISSVENLKKELSVRKPDAASIAEARKSVVAAVRSAQLKRFISDGFSRTQDGSFVDSTRAAAVAEFIVKSGTTNSDMPTSVVHLATRGGYTQTIKHNEAVAGLLRDALSGDSSVELELPNLEDDISVGSTFTIKAKKLLPNGKTVMVNYDFDGNNMVAVVNQATLDFYQAHSSMNEDLEVVPKLKKIFEFLIERLSH